MVSQHFALTEYIPVTSTLYQERGEKSIQLLDKCLVDCVEYLWECVAAKYAPYSTMILINGKCPVTGKVYTESGWRSADTKTGSRWSQHKNSKAADVKVYYHDGKKWVKVDPKDVYALIMANEANFIKLGLTTMEDLEFTPTWNHIDTRWWGVPVNKLVIVQP